jgi:tetratricopeptide (TPR) repeat protein
MGPKRSLAFLGILGIAAVLASPGCKKKEAAAPADASAAASATAGGGKIPVTTASEEARAEFLKGREMVDKLKITDSTAHFERAVSLDPNFALAELSLANSSPTGSGFFEHLGKAVAAADKASEGERLLILAAQAGANANTVKQKEHLDALIAAHPNDERAQFAMGGYHFGQLNYPEAIAHYRKATEIDPSFSSAFNLLGYALRQNGDFAESEKAFQKYIELIPNDPNPYDSYAELLMKMGRFEDSIAQYRKALAIDSNFIASHVGIAMDLMYMGKPAEAEAEIAQIAQKARTVAERRNAAFNLAVLHADSGEMAKALKDVDALQALAQQGNDVPALAGDHTLRGNILLEMGRADDAQAQFDSALKVTEDSNLSAEVKQNARLFRHFNAARVLLRKKDFAGAKKEATSFQSGAETAGNAGQIRLAHELNGSIALAEKDYARAIAELDQASPQNPYNLYRLCQAHQAQGDKQKARESCTRAADFNGLPLMNYAFVRNKAKAELKKLS